MTPRRKKRASQKVKKPSKAMLNFLLAERRQRNRELQDEIRHMRLQLRSTTLQKRELKLVLLRKESLREDDEEKRKQLGVEQDVLKAFNEVMMMWDELGTRMGVLEGMVLEDKDDTGDWAMTTHAKGGKKKKKKEKKKKKKKEKKKGGSKKEESNK